MKDTGNRAFAAQDFGMALTRYTQVRTHFVIYGRERGRGYTRAQSTRVCASMYVCAQGVELLSNVKCQEDDREMQMQALKINLLTNQVPPPHHSTPEQQRHGAWTDLEAALVSQAGAGGHGRVLCRASCGPDASLVIVCIVWSRLRRRCVWSRSGWRCRPAAPASATTHSTSRYGQTTTPTETKDHIVILGRTGEVVGRGSSGGWMVDRPSWAIHEVGISCSELRVKGRSVLLSCV